MDGFQHSTIHEVQCGRFIPVIDISKCEANGVCTHVCPYDVFRIKQMTVEDFNQLSFWAKFKTLLNDNRKCFAVHPELCTNCGLCVDRCPEGAIQIQVEK